MPCVAAKKKEKITVFVMNITADITLLHFALRVDFVEGVLWITFTRFIDLQTEWYIRTDADLSGTRNLIRLSSPKYTEDFDDFVLTTLKPRLFSFAYVTAVLEVEIDDGL